MQHVASRSCASERDYMRPAKRMSVVRTYVKTYAARYML